MKIVAHLATLGSREVFMLAVLLLVLAAALAAHEVGISPPLGAFLAGMILGETQFKHQVEEDIRPFRDVLLGLFFISVGLRVDLTVVLEYWLTVLDLLGVLVPLKGVIIYLIACLLREPSDVALRAATILAHGGEFSLLILTLALSQDALPPEVVQPLLGAVVLSMIAAPFLIRENERIALTITARAPNRSP